MNVYVEYIFLENLFTYFLIIYETGRLLKLQFSKTRLIISSLISTIYSVIVAMNEFEIINNILIKILIINISVYIVFKPKTFIKNIKIILTVVMFYMIFIGSVILLAIFLNINLSNYILKYFVFILSTIIIVLIRKNIFKIWKLRKKEDDFYYKLKFKISHDILEIKAFVDTGNGVKYTKKDKDLDVIFINNRKEFDYLKQISKANVDINLNSITGQTCLKGYEIEDVEILNDGFSTKLERAIIVFLEKQISITEDFDAILSFHTYIEKIKGVTI